MLNKLVISVYINKTFLYSLKQTHTHQYTVPCYGVYLVRGGHTLKSLECCLLQLLSVVRVRDSDELIRSLSHRLPKQLSNSKLCHNVMDVSPSGDNSRTYRVHNNQTCLNTPKQLPYENGFYLITYMMSQFAMISLPPEYTTSQFSMISLIQNKFYRSLFDAFFSKFLHTLSYVFLRTALREHKYIIEDTLKF